MTSILRALPLLVVLCVAAPADVVTQPGPAAAKTLPANAAIASAHPLATAAGVRVLEQGGNAFDAAVAVSAALAVVEPYGSGLGGGGFWLLHRAHDGFEVMVDGREVAPAAATRDMYLDDAGNPIERASRDGPLAAGIPGSPAALVHIATKYGRLPLKQTLAPAIELARNGSPASPRLVMGLKFKEALIRRWPAAGQVYLPDGALPAAGDTLFNPGLAATLESLAAQGIDGFYRGTVARKLVEGTRAAGGIWTLQDLAAYRVVEREPVYGEFGTTRIVTAPPPSAGGVALLNALHILHGYRLDSVGEVTRKHLAVEAMRRAFRDRGAYLGDPDFVDVPVERLIHPFYAAGQRASINIRAATASADLPGGFGDVSGGAQTTHFSVIDENGNRVAATMSLNFWYGSGFMAPGTGVMLNNEMDDFSIKPGVPDGYQLVGADANAIAPGKRMLSSMTPTFVETPQGVAILGTPGGSRIISIVLLATLARIDGADAQAMASLPRYHHQYLPDTITYEEAALSESEREALQALGHELRLSGRNYGNLQIVTWDTETGEVDAVSDPRGEGAARIY